MSHKWPSGNTFRAFFPTGEMENALNHEVAESLDDFGVVSAKKPDPDDVDLNLAQVMELNRLTHEIESTGLLDVYS